MAYTHKLKVGLLAIFSLFVLVWVIAGYFTVPPVSADTQSAEVIDAPAGGVALSDDYVGSETCMACHEDQFKAFSGTKHAKLKEVASWKGKVQGCESCHGPGSKHIEDPTVKGSIVAFNKMSAKATSETCLACHSGKESHNNFRRGEHWRNDVGCTDCHSPHGSPLGNSKAGSASFIGETTHQNPGIATVAMLKQSEPQLCMACHTETKSQFSKPFHHKVLEGTMKCTSCHNAHGGFESKQAKLSVGADVACIKCHGDKQGPFVFEHAPLKTEGCAACHTPHGSSNPKMLTRSSVRQMCIECHSSISDAEGGATPGAPQAPHNQSQVRYMSCTICHSKIHGSNSSNRFFR